MDTPNNHFGLFVVGFCERTNQTLKSLSKKAGIPYVYLKNYVCKGTEPKLKQMMKLADAMATIAKTARYSMFKRLCTALERDFNNEKYPPNRRILDETKDCIFGP